MALSRHGESKVLSLIKGAGPFYVGLMTVAASKASDGTEVTGGDYARRQVALTDPAFNSGTQTTVMQNSVQIEFPTASASWGTIVGWALFDAATAGNLVWYGDLSVAKEIASRDTVLLHVGDLQLTIS